MREETLACCNVRKLLEEKAIELVHIGVQNSWKCSWIRLYCYLVRCVGRKEGGETMNKRGGEIEANAALMRFLHITLCAMAHALKFKSRKSPGP